jgi:hypothetical protein
MSINIEALKRFTANTRHAIDWKDEPSGAARHVTIVIRSPKTYDSIGYQVMREAGCASIAAHRRSGHPTRRRVHV